MCATACGGGASIEGLNRTEPPAPALGALPSLPLVASSLSVESDSYSYPFSSGNLYASQGASMTSTHLTLDKDGLSWAIIGVKIGQSTPYNVKLNGTFSGEAYLGMADYARGTWTWVDSPLTAMGQIKLPESCQTGPGGSCYFALVCPDGSQAKLSMGLGLVPANPTWNFLFWLAADNDLASLAVQELNLLESISCTPSIRILAGYEIDNSEMIGEYYVAGVEQAHFIRVVPDYNQMRINTDGDTANRSFPSTGFNSADPARIREFLDWAQANFPATNTMLMLWDHGTGWRPGWTGDRSASREASAILTDQHAGTSTLTDLRLVRDCLGTDRLDVLVFSACNMGEIEVAYEFRNHADWVVGCCRVMHPNAIPFHFVVKDLIASYPFTSDDVARVITQRTQDCTATNTTRLIELAGNLSQMVTAIKARPTSEAIAVMQAINSSGHDDSANLGTVIWKFAAQYQAITSDAEIKGILDDVYHSYSAATENGFGPHAGLSIFLPHTGALSTSLLVDYAKLDFSRDTRWHELFTLQH